VSWVADRRHGFVGYEPPAGNATPQPRFVLDKLPREVAMATPAELMEKTRREFDFYFHVAGHEAPAFSGGVWDAWPARATQVLAVMQQETAIIREVQRAEERRRG